MNNTIFGRQHIGNQFPQQPQAPKRIETLPAFIVNQISESFTYFMTTILKLSYNSHTSIKLPMAKERQYTPYPK
jgi:hypothetical protein